MEICTVEEVFDFMGTENDVRLENTNFISFLIKNISEEIENIIGRKIRKTEFKNLKLKNNINCYFTNGKIYLKNHYRDIYSLTEFLKNGTNFTDYVLDKDLGCIFIKNLNFDDLFQISGYLGLVNKLEKTLSELKLLCLEMIAVKSKLWTRNIYTLEGAVKTLVLDITENSNNILKKYCIKEF